MINGSRKTLLAKNSQVVASIGLMLMFLGCAGGSDADVNREETVPAAGTVTYNGTPVEGAKIALIPETKGKPGAAATSIEGGKFVLLTYETGDGAAPGDYIATVTKVEYPQGSTASEDDPDYDPNAPEPKPKYLVPEKYSSAAKSGLKVTIPAGGIENIELKLED